MKKSNTLTFLQVAVSIIGSFILVYGALIWTDATNTEKLNNIEKAIPSVMKLESILDSHISKSKFYKEVIDQQLSYMGKNLDQLQKTTNVLTVQVRQNATIAQTIISTNRDLTLSINKLNTTIARLDERMITVEDK